MTAIILPFPTTESVWIDVPSPHHNGGTADEYLSQERCIDWLLDRFQSTTDPALRRLVSDVIAEIRDLGTAEYDPELCALVIDALASVETAFEMTGSGDPV